MGGVRGVLRSVAVGVLTLGVMAAAFAQDVGIIKEISIRGTKKISPAVVKALLQVREGQILNLKAIEEDRQRIVDMGWFRKVNYNKTLLADNTWQLIYDVDENEVVREVAVVGNSAIKTEDILKLVQFKPAPGAKEEDLRPLNLSEIKPSLDAIQRLYEDQGYFGRVEALDPDPYSPGTWLLRIKEAVINSISIEGFTSTKDKVFNRLIKSKPGQPYSRFQWEKDALRVINTQWFEGVSPTQPALSILDSGLVDLKMKLNDGRTGMFNAGVVLNPQNPLAGTISYSDSNFNGTGQNVAFNYTQATVQGTGGSISFDYANPFADSRDSTFRASIYDRVQFRFINNAFGGGNLNAANQYSERRTGGSMGFTNQINEKKSLTISSRFERVNVPPFDPASGNVNNFIQQDGEVGVLGFSSINNTRDLDFDPARGTFLRLDVEPGFSTIKPVSTNITGDNPEGRFGFVRLGFDYRSYYTPNKKRRTADDVSREVYAFRLRGGTVQGVIPFFEQYFAGGNDSVRGFQEDRFWGKNLLMASFEWRKPVQDQFSLVTFLDLGSAWGGYGSGAGSDFTQSNSFSLKMGYGLGLRLRTPMGPIRLDFAFNNEGGSRPHFMIGTSF